MREKPSRSRLVVFYGPTDRHPSDTEMIGDRLHTVGATTIGFGDGSIAFAPAFGILLYPLGDRATLTLRYLFNWAFRIDHRLHALDERLRSQIDLVLLIPPHPHRTIRAMGDLTPFPRKKRTVRLSGEDRNEP